MMRLQGKADLKNILIGELPFLRRYARSLCGEHLQVTGLQWQPCKRC